MRKSSFSAPGTWTGSHVAPPSVVRQTAPRLPLAQATEEETATERAEARFGRGRLGFDREGTRLGGNPRFRPRLKLGKSLGRPAVFRRLFIG